MQHTQTILASIVLGIVIIVTTLAQGYHSERWHDHSDSPELKQMAKNLEQVPMRFGDWIGTDIETTPEMKVQYEVAKVNGFRNISYQNVLSGKVVQISLVSGHHSTIGIHTPDKCMIGAGFRVLEGESERGQVFNTPVGEARVRTAQFVKDTPTATINQRMLWTFSHDGEWQASELGRASLTGSLGWFKLYVTTAATGKNVLDASESQGFLVDFIPRLNESLFPKATTPAATSPASETKRDET
jgi:hypothetical protein